jgi:hypothetical protein
MRLLTFLFCIFLAATGPWWLTAGAFFVYAARWQGSELLLLALAADVFFHQPLALPVYTMATAATLLFFIMFMPLLKVYNQQ